MIKFVFVSLALLLVTNVFAGGREGSGGGGVVCFSNLELSQQASLDIQNTGTLNPNLLKQIQSIVTLEYWENYPPLESPYSKDVTFNEILSDLQTFFSEYSPIFASRRELVSQHMSFSKWVAKDHLPKIRDANPTRDIPATCQFIQLAVRYTVSKPGYLPEVSVDFNRDLFHLLSPFNQAMLIIHEELYMIGKELNHPDSDEIRQVVAILLSKNLRDEMKNAPHHSHAARILQLHLGSIFGDYYLFFLDDPKNRPAFTPAGYSQYSRYRSFGSLLKKLRSRKESCLIENNYDQEKDQKTQQQIQEKCSFHAVDPNEVHTFVSDEEAFLFLTRWVLDSAGAIDTSEVFVVFNRENPNRMTEYQVHELRRACDHLRNSNYIKFSKTQKKANTYCSTLF